MKKTVPLWKAAILLGALGGINSLAQPLTNLNDIISARSTVPQPENGRVATNTLAFEAYGLGTMLEQANQTIQKWRLDNRKPLAARDVSFWLKPKATSIQGTMSTRDSRFVWAFDEGWLNLFTDNANSSRSVYYRKGPEEFRKLVQTKSLITGGQAVAMARGYLHSLGLSEKQLRLHEPPKVTNSSVLTDDGRTQNSPFFEIGWSVEGANPDAKEAMHNNLNN